MKKSEARILMYLKSASIINRYGKQIAQKLNMDYKYTLEILDNMTYKGWIEKDRQITKFYYHIKSTAPVQEAVDIVTQNNE